LGSSEPSGICYIETKNLDGETNLKHKEVHKLLKPFGNESILAQMKGECETEEPNDQLYTFEGRLKVELENEIV